MRYFVSTYWSGDTLKFRWIDDVAGHGGYGSTPRHLMSGMSVCDYMALVLRSTDIEVELLTDGR